MPRARGKYREEFKEGADEEARRAARELGALAVGLAVAGVIRAAPHIGRGVIRAAPHIGRGAAKGAHRIGSVAGRGKDSLRSRLGKAPGIGRLLQRRVGHSSAPKRG